MLGVGVLLGASGAAPPEPARPLPPFLQLFTDHHEAPVRGGDVTVASAVGRVSGYRARPDTAERLPAVLLVPGEGGLTDWVKESTRDLAGVGYVTLAVDLPHRGTRPKVGDEATLAELSAAVRWLRRGPDVLPERVGVVGWSWGAGQALALASATPLQACVVCDGPVSADPATLAGLRGTPVLGLFAGRGESAPTTPAALRKALAAAHLPHKVEVYDGAGAGFFGPPGQPGHDRATADKAWVEVYEFLGKYVEDAPPQPVAVVPTVPREVARIADLMRAVNEPTGVRGRVLRNLEQEPGTARQWQQVRSNAALMAEVGRLLRQRTPPRDPGERWRAEAEAYTAAAERLASAAEGHNYAAARHALDDLGATCVSCHRRHR